MSDWHGFYCAINSRDFLFRWEIWISHFLLRHKISKIFLSFYCTSKLLRHTISKIILSSRSPWFLLRLFLCHKISKILLSSQSPRSGEIFYCTINFYCALRFRKLFYYQILHVINFKIFIAFKVHNSQSFIFLWNIVSSFWTITKFHMHSWHI